MDDVLILKRYYTSLKRAPEYKKRVTWVEKFPVQNCNNVKCIAVVEYIGTFPQKAAPHGNAKNSDADYVKSSEAVKMKLTKKITDNNDSFVLIDWKNNSCESMNHILKLSCNWKVQKVTDLIEKFFRIVKLQYADMRRSLYGIGDFQIAPWMAKCKVNQINWATKSEEEKDKLFQKFLKGVPKKGQKMKSTDGRLEIPRTQKVARKPGQRKRVKSVRTR